MSESVKGRKIGVVSGEHAEVGFIWLLRISGVGLVLVSIVGSFYGLRGKAVSPPLAIVGDLVRFPWALVSALAVQAVLSLAQWGARHRAKSDTRWWGAFAVALLISAGLNWVAYGTLMLAWGWPVLLAGIAVIAGDAIAELLLVA